MFVTVFAISVAFGSAHLFKVAAQYVEVGPIQPAGPTEIQGRIMCYFGPPHIMCCLDVDGRPEHRATRSFVPAVRNWLCIYPIETNYDFSRMPPGKYRVTLLAGDPRENAPRAAVATVVVSERR